MPSLRRSLIVFYRVHRRWPKTNRQGHCTIALDRLNSCLLYIVMDAILFILHAELCKIRIGLFRLMDHNAMLEINIRIKSIW